jgi:hypothetical protein
MQKVLVAIGAVAVGVLLVPDDASAQRRGFAPMGGFHAGAGMVRGGMIGARPGIIGYGSRVGGYRAAFGGYGYRGIGNPGRRWAYGGYRPYYRRDRGHYGFGGAVAAGLVGAAALGSLGYYGTPYDAGYAYSYPAYGYPDQGGVVYETYPAGLTQPCAPGPGCRADGYPDARYYYGRAYGY